MHHTITPLRFIPWHGDFQVEENEVREVNVAYKRM